MASPCLWLLDAAALQRQAVPAPFAPPAAPASSSAGFPASPLVSVAAEACLAVAAPEPAVQLLAQVHVALVVAGLSVQQLQGNHYLQVQALLARREMVVAYGMTFIAHAAAVANAPCWTCRVLSCCCIAS